ncbi:MAG: hypothetical protein ABSH48_11925 [Verrucomicrobiota bacterium]|jgi:hypothetical protein
MKPLVIGCRMTLLCGLLALPAARAFPPAPDGVIYGMVKDQYGTPLMNASDTVILQTPSGVTITAAIQPALAIGVNYLLRVPMDSGIAGQPYVTNALVAATPYLLYVAAGTTTNLPIEMAGASPVLGRPAQLTLQNLTVGVDSNGDGIPDAWELLFFQEIGTNVALANINPNADYAHDGRTLWQEYLLGNYPFNPGNNFAVKIVSQNAGSAVLAFTTMTGRTYTAFGSADLQNWTALSFTIPSAGPAVTTSYYAANIQPVQIQTVQPASGPQMQFFRLQLQ